MNPKLLKERIRTSAQRPDVLVAVENLTRRPLATTPRPADSKPRPAHLASSRTR